MLQNRIFDRLCLKGQTNLTDFGRTVRCGLGVVPVILSPPERSSLVSAVTAQDEDTFGDLELRISRVNTGTRPLTPSAQ